MSRLKARQSLAQFAVNAIVGIFAVCIFFSVLHIALLEDERASIRDALDARARAETKLQRAARGVCNDHPQRAGRTLEPTWTPDGQLECVVVVAQEAAQ